MKLIDQFDRVYIVNLPERSDRRREMDMELGRHGLRADGGRIRYWKAVRPEDAGKFPSLGARGCFLSHLAILNDAIESDLNNVLVMEDDLAIDERLARDQPQMCRTLREGRWDFAYLGHVEAFADDAAAPAWKAEGRPLATTHLYALNRRVMRPLRDHLQACLAREPGHPLGSPMHVDGAYSLFRMQHPDALTLIAAPSLGGQRSSRSDIFPNKWYDRTPGLVQVAGWLRAIKNQGKRLLKSSPISGEQQNV
ncbi:MAG: glycosyltransferase family 25 protein [Proteobacteria bacterium]|nr:glycosyltransferase family 25 protein [Pseudomonadota bacterium]